MKDHADKTENDRLTTLLNALTYCPYDGPIDISAIYMAMMAML